MGGLYKLVLQWLWLMRRGSTEVRFLIGEFPTLFGTDLGERLQLWARWGGFLQSSDLNDELGDMALCVQFVVFFLQFPFGLVLPMDPEICSQFVCGMAEACRMPECFTTCCRYVSINGNILVKGDQQTLRFSLCSSDAGPLQALCSLPGKVAGCWCGRWGPITNQRLLDLLPAHQPSISTWCALAEVDPPRNKYSGQGRQL